MILVKSSNMNANSLVLLVGILGIKFCSYFLIIGKDTSSSLIGFICGASLIFYWERNLRKKKKID